MTAIIVRQSYPDRGASHVGTYTDPLEALKAARLSASTSALSAWIGDGTQDLVRVYPDGAVVYLEPMTRAAWVDTIVENVA